MCLDHRLLMYANENLVLWERLTFSSPMVKHLVAIIDNVPSVDNLNFILECDALGHTGLDQQGHESQMAEASMVTLEDVTSAPLLVAMVTCVPKYLYVKGVEDLEFDNI
uniref:Uncharacterized protein n=1 Tax=Physcomitrium patens TaxID=3218 RepID=A0A2K1IDD6_PHYPA|nr:hypothetical protein PHYPA_029441 [Physcomitrium patens]